MFTGKRILFDTGNNARIFEHNVKELGIDLTRLDAVVETASAEGGRSIPIADFHRLPDDRPKRDTILAPGELITHVTLPPPPPGRQLYRKVRDRASYAFALVSVAAAVEVEGGRVKGARIALGGVAHKPWRKAEAEAAMADKAPAAAADAAADILLAGARGHGANDFKIPLARRTLAAVLSSMEG